VSPGLKQMLATHLPETVQARLLRLRKPVRRVRYHMRERLHPVGVGRTDLAAALRELGLGAGDGVFVHSALSRLGSVDGGPATVLSAFDEVLGPAGLVAMPSFPYVGSTVEYLRPEPTFDVRRTPSRMGAVTEALRQQPGVVRSLHPTHPVCARGPGAEELVAGHDVAPTPFGPGSPYARMVERGMHQVWLGVGITTFTLYHTFEALAGDAFPFPVLLDEPFAVRCIDADGAERTVTTLAHDPAISARKDKDRAEMRRRLLAGGVLRRTHVGRGEMMSASMPPLMEQLHELLADGLTIYDMEFERRPRSPA
jgi:aminoglycoside 3-N-acetyltransferase